MVRKYLLSAAIAFLTSIVGAHAAINNDIPDRDGMTLKGLVYCGNDPVPGVQVSDGVNITYTDENGWYYLASSKECGYVFICNPHGYKTKQEGMYAQFFRYLWTVNNPAEVERADFELEREANPDHVAVFLADIQMADRNNDKEQFMTRVVPDVNATIDYYKDQGKDVYAITLGDQSYDRYWQYGFGITEVKAYMENLHPTIIYNCMGNHDHNPEIAGDWPASIDFRLRWGPTYYSFNAGNVHYVVLDNIEYKNPKANVDDRSYDCNIVTQIMKWFRKDIANVDKSTPLVICMHAPLFARPQCTSPGVLAPQKYHYDFGPTFYNCVKGFKDVRVFTGHTHYNFTQIRGTLTEYNVGAVCGNLWWTGSNVYTPGNHLCIDGSVGGYRVLENVGSDMTTYYKSIAFDRDYQFRTYDLNQCHITAERFCPDTSRPGDLKQWMTTGKFGYDDMDYNFDGTPKKPNRILINVFAYDTRWKVEAFENGEQLEVTRVNQCDPLVIISGGCLRLNNNHELIGTTTFNPTQNAHFFEAQAKSATSTLIIKVTDEYGNVYTEEMERPKEFSIARYMPDFAGTGVKSPAMVGPELPVEYYDLRGVRVGTPRRGCYIKRQGAKSTKVLLK